MLTTPDGDPRHLALRMAEVARVVAAPRTAAEICMRISTTALELIPGVDAAAVLLMGKKNALQTVGPTDRLSLESHELQRRFGEGPCLQALRDDVVVCADDFAAESRWPRYSPAAVELGIRGAMSLRLFTADQTAGVLSLVSYAARGWSNDAQITGMVLAAHAAAAITASRQAEQLTSALASRDRIGQAKGIVMERYAVGDTQAFDMLRQLSQESNRRLTDIAADVIDTRTTHSPDRDAPPPDKCNR